MKKYFSSYWIRSAFFTFLQRFSLTLFGLVNFMILIRSFSHEEMGTWALFLIVVSLFEMNKTNLLKNAHIRFASATDNAEERARIASSSLLVNLGVTLLFILLLLFLSDQLSSLLNAGPDLTAMLLMFIPGLISMVFFSHFEAIQQSSLDFKGVFAGYFVRQVLFFGIVCYHFFSGTKVDLVDLAAYQSVSIIAGTLVMYWFTRRYLSFIFRPSRKGIMQILGYGKFILGSGLVANMYSNLDQLMIAYFLAPESVSYYNAAARINQLVDIPSYAASEVLFPKMVQASHQSGADKVRYLYERMVAILLCITVPMAVFILCFPKWVITLLAGSDYIAAALILQLYMITGILRPMQNQAANLLNSTGKPGLCFIINAVSLAFNLAINYYCLKQFGFYGAAIGTLITCFIGTTVWYWVLSREINFRLGRILQYSADTYRTMFHQATQLLHRAAA